MPFFRDKPVFKGLPSFCYNFHAPSTSADSARQVFIVRNAMQRISETNRTSFESDEMYNGARNGARKLY